MVPVRKKTNGRKSCTGPPIKRDGAKYYWCEDGHFFDDKLCRMYCIHKPGDGHIALQAWKNKLKKDNALKKGNAIPAPSITLPSSGHLMQPNLTLAIPQSFHFQSLCSKHWWPKQVFLKINSRRSRMTHVLPWETKWPQIKKGDYNGLFLTSIYILFSGCHFYPSTISSNHIKSNNIFYCIINQASNPMAILCS